MIRKDFKIGLIVGLFILISGMIWLSTGTELSPQRKLAITHQQNLQEKQSTTTDSSLEPPSPIATPPIHPETPSPTPLSPLRPTIASSTPEATKVTEQSRESTHRTHQVQSGETLSDIAFHYYGSSAQWRKIQAANPDLLANPNKIRIGMRLIIPD